GADQEEKMLLWLTERLGATVHVPRLQELGYTLVGGRLLPAGSKPAAQLMYEDAQAERMTLYIRERWKPSGSGQPERSVSYATEDQIGLVYWVEGPFAYGLIGAMDREQLFATAETVQQQLTVPVIPPTPEQTATTEKDAT